MPSRRYPRTARVNEVVREVVADELEHMAGDDARLDRLTVTSVEVDPDLRYATVFVDAPGADTVVALDEFRVRLQSAIARQVRLKRTPQLSFAPDPGVTSGTRVEEILRTIRRDEHPR